MQIQNWRPDYVVGLARGGLTPAVMISQYLEVPMHSLKVSLRDGGDCESNLWMAEEAFGYVDQENQPIQGCRWDPALRQNILIVDDINDSGATFAWIQNDWQSSCLPRETSAWDRVWNHNVRFAVLVNNETSNFKSVDYAALAVNKLEDPQWIVFPWEQWW
jgi:hypoxanthine phosphoribosyltransferase